MMAKENISSYILFFFLCLGSLNLTPSLSFILLVSSKSVSHRFSWATTTVSLSLSFSLSFSHTRSTVVKVCARQSAACSARMCRIVCRLVAFWAHTPIIMYIKINPSNILPILYIYRYFSSIWGRGSSEEKVKMSNDGMVLLRKKGFRKVVRLLIRYEMIKP